MGRPAKPTALHVVNGNPGKRALNDREPEPDLLGFLMAHGPRLADWQRWSASLDEPRR